MPTHGGHCADHDDLVQMVKEIHAALLGQADPEGHEGVVAKVRRHDGILKFVQRLMWSVIVTVIGGVVAIWFRWWNLIWD